MTNCKFKIGDKVRRVNRIIPSIHYQTEGVVVHDVEWSDVDKCFYLSFHNCLYAQWKEGDFELVEGE